ncbi:hypothetical protein [Thermoactinomyces mirandus]|uniref:Fungal lipase-like domain-containing protein n=1 Tax=Thermoactinomyces mirandus TaxID=2756294 RepID=A0A7W1XR89_9BACL|nr:hypothetical protein [Thermoactinomyces mirandus]MBA4601818.1 hypothetical protein [Thermoactinomyces mirandus]
MKILHQVSVILFFILVVSFIGIHPVGATGGGSFEIPDVNDDFNKVEQTPAPAKESPITETRQEKGFFDKVGDFFSGTWEKTKTGLKTAKNWTVSKAKGAWGWLTSETGKVAGGIAFGAAAITAIFRRYGQQIKKGVQSAYSGARQWIRNLLGRNSFSDKRHLTASTGSSIPGSSNVGQSHPQIMLNDIKVSDRQLAEISDLVYEEKIDILKLKETLGDGWETSLKCDSANGLEAYVFINKESSEMIIAFRGTEPDKWYQDIVIGDIPIALGNDIINPQAVKARELVESVINNPEYQGYNIVLTGHSLGGYLALDSAARYKIPAVTFNAPGKNLFRNVNASTLLGGLHGPLGAEVATELIYKLNQLDPQVRAEAANEKAGTYDGLIRNYRYNDDTIGSLGYRPGVTYEIESDGSVHRAEDEDGLDNQLGLSPSSHSITNFTGIDDDGNKVDTPIPDVYDENGNIRPR